MKSKSKILLSLLCLSPGYFHHSALCETKSKSKWIVVTSINYPTKALKKLATLEDWHLVVVGDKKTPADWHLENCDYLSLEKQEELQFHITKLLPWNHYSRKNIGYLYAIKNGATIIYDTDDDNILIHDTIEYLPPIAQTLLYQTNESVVNPYAHFGQPSVWPRGYPLDKILSKKSLSTRNIKSYAQLTTNNAYIQQGLADLDPDVDAIFRLTQGTNYIIFNPHAQPICLPEGTMCPFNTQNTIIYEQAFWGLLIPITTPFRVCDIWRGYWAQRLLWDIGGNLCFMPSTVIQERNEHNLMHDFIDEIDLYIKAGPLVTFLKNWQSKQDMFFDRVIELTDAMVTHNFYQEKDSALIRAWLQDLHEIGYQQPSLISSFRDIR